MISAANSPLIRKSPLWFPLVFLFLSILAIPQASLQVLFPGGEAKFFTLCQIPPGQSLFVTQATGALIVPLNSSSAPSFTTLHINQWFEGRGACQIYLQDETAQKRQALSRRPINRHSDFNITRYLKSGHVYSLALEVAGPDAKAYLDELTVRQFPGVPYFPPVSLCLTVAIAWAILLARLVDRRLFAPVRHWEIIGLLVAVAFAWRWCALGAAFGQPLEGDAGSYHGLTMACSWARPFQNGIREPFYIWIQKMAMLIWGTAPWKFRLTTLLLSVGSIPLLYLLCAALAGRRGVAIIACLLAALGEYAVADAVRGERDQLFTFLVLAFSLGVVKMAPASWKRETRLGILAGLLSWTWLAGALGACLAYLYRWARWKVPFRRTLAFWIPLALLLGGFLCQQSKYSGDPLQSLNAHVNFYKNAKATGVPSYAGEKTTWLRYLWGSQGAVRVVKDSATGTLSLFLNPTDPFNKIFLGFHYSQIYSYFLFPFLLLGFAATVRWREWGSWALVFSFLNLSASLLNDVRDPRLFYHILPFFAYFFACGVWTVGHFFRNMRFSRFRRPEIS